MWCMKIPNPGEEVVENDNERCSTVLKEAEGESGGSGGFVSEGGSRDATGFRERGDVDGEGCNGEDLEGGVRGLVVRMSV